MIVAIKFRQDFDRWKAGDTARLEPTLMQRLIDAGKAVAYMPPSARKRKPEPKPEPKPKAKKPTTRKKKSEKAVKL
jgi:hypothetical protein